MGRSASLAQNAQALNALAAAGPVTQPSSGSSVINGYIWGFKLANDSTSPLTVLDVAAGYASDSTNASMITGTAFTKSISSTWTAGSGNGGMSTGLTIAANTWYHVFAIINSGSYDVYFDTSPIAANAPAGTTSTRYIGSFKTNASSQIWGFTQNGQRITWNVVPQDLSAGTATTFTSVTLSTPPGFVTYPNLQLQFLSNAVNQGLVISDSTLGISSCVVPNSVVNITAVANYVSLTNTSSQIQYRIIGTASVGGSIYTLGYINPHVASNF